MLLVISVGVLTAGLLSAGTGDSAYNPSNEVASSVDDAEELTVVGVQETTKTNGSLRVYDEEGRLVYTNHTYSNYWDVDPVPGERYTVQYFASGPGDCETAKKTKCIEAVIQLENISTGDTRRIYATNLVKHELSPLNVGTDHAVAWHDVDRLNGTHYVVGDMTENRVFVVNVTSGHITWEWQVKSDYPFSSGGVVPYDWAHLNDVEVVRDRQAIMVSLRNHDQVVFLNRKTGELMPELTVGEDDNHSVMYEQHNPDYIPVERGGPAVIVADSQNSRIVEYQRVDGRWKQSWIYETRGLSWPRDADRLPNGHTLITESTSNRVFEIDEEGDVVWSVDIAHPYEAERLGTGDESAGGENAASLGLPSERVTEEESAQASLSTRIKGLFPTKLVNALKFVTPRWMGVIEFGALVVALLSAVLLTGYEIVARWTLTISWPVSVSRR